MKNGWRTRIVRALLHGILLFFLLVLQTSFFAWFPLHGVTPDLVLVATLSIGLLRGPWSGAGWGAVGGVLCDVLTGRLIGLGGLILALLGLGSGAIGLRLFGERLTFALLLSPLGSLFHLALYGAGAWAFGVQMPILQGLSLMAPWLMLYNALVTLILHPVLSRFYPSLDVAFDGARASISNM